MMKGLTDMRRLRLLQDGARYHVVARTNRKEMILEAQEMKSLFQETLRKAKLRYRFALENFCIMGNHYHLVIRPCRGESLSRIMQWIMSRFAMAYNKVHDLTGHVWGARFFSRILDGLHDLLQTFRYIDENPVAAGLASSSFDWKFGGLFHSRSGWRNLVDPLPLWLQLLMPERRRTK